MKLQEICEGVMSAKNLEQQETLMQKFSLSDHDAEEVLDFVLGNADWEDLSDDARKALYSHYEKTAPFGTSKEHVTDPEKFIRVSLKTDLGIK
jgi:hypothetical protein